jgi:chromosome segregation ATPase
MWMEFFAKGKSEKTISNPAIGEKIENKDKEEQLESQKTNMEGENRIPPLLRDDNSNGNDIFNVLNNLKDELEEFEKIKKAITEKIGTISALIPKYNERREFLTKQINEKEKQIAEIDDLTPKLVEKKQNLNSNILQGKEEIKILEGEIKERQEKYDEINQIIPKLEQNREKINESINKMREDISKIEKQIEQIYDVQKYGEKILSTLTYETKKKV